nr:mobilization protein [Streptomyces sp.]
MSLVAACFSTGESHREGWPTLVSEDSLGVVRDGSADITGQCAAVLLPQLSALQLGEGGSERVISRGLEMLEGSAGGVGLVSVAFRLVPAPGENRRPDHGREQGSEGAAIRASGSVDDVASCDAYGVGGPVFGPGPEEVKIRIRATGVCHSDLSLISGELPGGGGAMIVGHEGAGEVVEVGDQVTAVAPVITW